MFGTRCLQKMPKDNKKPFKIHSSKQIVIYINFIYNFSYIHLGYSTKLSQQVSYFSYRDALPHISNPYVNSKIIYVMHLLTPKRLTLHFTKPLVNVALKFYAVILASCNFNFNRGNPERPGLLNLYPTLDTIKRNLDDQK